MSIRLTALFLLSAASALSQSDQKFSIRGRLIDDLTQQPVRNARVTLTGTGMAKPLSALNDDRGGFSFSDRAPGSYIVKIEKSGYFPPAAIDANLGGVDVDLGDTVVVRMRSISGRLKWTDGEPVSQAAVRVFRLTAGKPDPSFAVSLSANEAGEYYASGLRPGRYVVAAGPYANLSRVARPRVARPQFYPGIETPIAALPIDLRKTAEAAEISFTLKDVGGVAVEGELIPSTRVTKGTPLYVALSIPGVPTSPFMLRDVSAGDTFRFLDVPEGDYLLLVSARQDLTRGYLPIHVGQTPLTGLRVNAPEPTPVTFHVELEEADKTRLPVPTFGLSGRAEKLGIYGEIVTGSGSVRKPLPNGDLQSTDLAAGETYAMDFRGSPDDAYVESVTQGTREKHGGPFEFVANGEMVQILLRKDAGSVSGAVRESKGAFVVLAPADRKALNRYRTASASRDGSFTLERLAPGEYDLFAFDRNDEDYYRDEDYLRKYASKSTHLTVGPNAKMTASVEVIKVN